MSGLSSNSPPPGGKTPTTSSLGGVETSTDTTPFRNSTTVTEYKTTTATPTFVFVSSVIATEIKTQYRTTPGPNPDATAAIASASAVLASSGSITSTKFIILVSIGGATFLLLLIVAIAILIYLRHRRRKAHSSGDSPDSPPLTSLAPERPQTPFNPLAAPLFSTRPPPESPFLPPRLLGAQRSLNIFPAMALNPETPATPRPPPRPRGAPTRPRRSLSAPILVPELQQLKQTDPELGRETIGLALHSPSSSVYSKDKDMGNSPAVSSPISPSQGPPGSARSPRFREAIMQLPEEARGRVEKRRKEQAQAQGQQQRFGAFYEDSRIAPDTSGSGPGERRIGVVPKTNTEIQKQKEWELRTLDRSAEAGVGTSAVSSEMMFIHRDIERNRRRDGSRGTKASSGIFPER